MKEMQNKRGQVTIFIILGIVIVIGVVGFFMLSPNFSNPNAKFPEVTRLVEDCIEETTLDAIYFNSLQGGYYETPEPKLNIDFFEIPIYFNKGQKNIISKEQLEQELEKYISDSLFCSEYLSQSGKDISEDGVKEVRVSITDKVNVKVNYPINIQEEDSSIRLSSFQKEVSFDLNNKVSNVNEFLELQSNDPKNILFSQMEKLAAENNYQIEFFQLGNTSNYNYNFIYEKDKFNNRSFVFSFGVSY